MSKTSKPLGHLILKRPLVRFSVVSFFQDALGQSVTWEGLARLLQRVTMGHLLPVHIARASPERHHTTAADASWLAPTSTPNASNPRGTREANEEMGTSIKMTEQPKTTSDGQEWPKRQSGIPHKWAMHHGQYLPTHSTPARQQPQAGPELAQAPANEVIGP
ncbi:hypothetical protein THAOC_22853 [Thalassiosira oceanica]|uniref:Uncharacterized protein n=1 Tax=Thalassiosira oceanica TaxID=159749 RepID=K0SEW0_THAOC|nr:hypothetical protein THAOC_22853 [Thalassiosira oceanica]|eukprot:EJK57137.1 hypothetical protein THAOC_22853 [Thalassiosira oceanica]